ncbi:hypothetical protein U1Q18_050863 [Sarracenia purpurea var. burkii]
MVGRSSIRTQGLLRAEQGACRPAGRGPRAGYGRRHLQMPSGFQIRPDTQLQSHLDSDRGSFTWAGGVWWLETEVCRDIIVGVSNNGDFCAEAPSISGVGKSMYERGGVVEEGFS